MHILKVDFNALTILLSAIIFAWMILYSLQKKYNYYLQKQCLYHSNLNLFKDIKKSQKERLHKLPKLMILLSFTLLAIAFVNPSLYINKSNIEPPTEDVSEGVAIYLALDRSSSMEKNISHTSKTVQEIKLSRMDTLKKTSIDFINGDKNLKLNGRKNDLIGLIAFARSAEILAPLTFDHKNITDILDSLQTVKNSDEDGTAIGYAIFKTANLIAATKKFTENKLSSQESPAYDIKSSVIILITDGINNPHQEDSQNKLRSISLKESAEYAQKYNIKLYIISIEPSIKLPRYIKERENLEKAAQITGGKFYIADSSEHLQNIYKEIDTMEKSRLYTNNNDHNTHQYVSIFRQLIILSLIIWLIAELLDKTYLRKSP